MVVIEPIVLDATDEYCVLRICQVNIAMATRMCGIKRDDVIKIFMDHCPSPNTSFDGEASDADLRKFFLKTLKGIVSVMEKS